MINSLEVEHEVFSTCLFNESNDAFLVFSLDDNCVIEANPTAQRLTGFRKKELISRELTELFDAHATGAIEAMIEEYKTTGFFHAKDGYQLRCHEREPLEVNVSVSRIHTEPVPLGLVVVRDVTQRKRAESQLQELQEELRQRDAELAHLARVSSIGQMSAELAHEINQPLFAIKNYATAAAAIVTSDMESRQAELAKWIQQIRAETTRVAAVIRHMTGFVRATPGEAVSTDINELVRGVAVLMEARIRARDSALQMEFDESLPNVFIQPLLIEQVLVNLIQNALDAMNDNQPDSRIIQIRTRRASDVIDVSVCDSSKGFSGESDHFFDPFYTTNPKGIGLGLTISRSTIEAHSGRLWATSNEDGGATFQFSLPI